MKTTSQSGIKKHIGKINTSLAIGFLFLIFNFSFLIVSSSQSRAVPFTLEDRDRIIQIQEKLNSQQKQIADLKESTQQQITGLKESTQQQIAGLKESTQQQITGLKESTQQQITDLRSLFYWAFGILVTLMLFVLGFIIWDRRTAMDPIRERTQLLIQTLREYAKDQPKLADVLRSHGIL